jgi:Tfp pilus assembly protein PilF
VKCLKKVRQLNPKYVAAIKLMGEIYLKEKKFDRAFLFLKEAMQLDPKDAEILVMLGNMLQEHRKAAQAVKYYQMALY